MKRYRGLRAGRKSGDVLSTMTEMLESRVLLSSAMISASATALAQAHSSQPLIDVVSNTGSASPIGLTPVQVRGAYGISTVTFGAVQGDGTGQTIAIIDAFDDPDAFSDLQAFDTQFGLPDPPSFQKLNENGLTSPLPSAAATNVPHAWGLEISLDIEWAHVMAPGASIDLIECNSNSDFDLIVKGAATAATLPDVSVVSMSFGGSEFTGESNLDPLFLSPSADSGVTFLASTGDSGSPGEYPAYSQNVVAVGGTSLTVTGSNTYGSETGWSGSGGGISENEFQPSFQTPSFTSTQRTIPDVSMDADPNTGVPIYDSYDSPGTPWIQVGGTSLAAPLWAGTMAVVNQGRVSNLLPALSGAGQTLPLLYGLPSTDFNDVTSGSNGGFSAGPGYDLVTGRGSPIASALIPALATATAPALLPDLQPDTPGGWSAPLLLSTTLNGTTDPTMIVPGDDVFLGAAWFNNGAASAAAAFDTDIQFGGSDLETVNTQAGFAPGEIAESLPDEDNDLGAISAGIGDLSYNIDINNTVAESTETNNTYNRTYVIDNIANDHYVLELDPTGKNLEIFENTVLQSIEPALGVNGVLFYLSGANDTLTVDASNGNPIPYGQVVAGGTATTNTMTVNGTSGNNTLTINQSQLTLNGQTINYSGLGSITINTGSGNDSLTQTAAPTAAVTFSAGGGSNMLTVDAGAVAIPAATSTYTPQTFSLISILSGASVNLNASTLPKRTLLQVGSLSNAGLLNLSNNDMIVQGAGESGYGTINNEVVSGRGGSGLWNGSTGITSSTAATVAAGTLKNTALGVVLNDTNQTHAGSLSGTKIFTTFDGQSVNDGDVLVKYTYYGDALLTGSVNAADYIQIDSGFGSGGTLGGWYNGDFNYDGLINGDDYTLIDNAFNTQSGVSLAAVPANQIASPTAPAAKAALAVSFSTQVIAVSPSDGWSISTPPPPPLADDLLDAAADAPR
jgi:hypothetical protein